MNYLFCIKGSYTKSRCGRWTRSEHPGAPADVLLLPTAVTNFSLPICLVSLNKRVHSCRNEQSPFITSSSCSFSLKCLYPANGLSAMQNTTQISAVFLPVRLLPVVQEVTSHYHCTCATTVIRHHGFFLGLHSIVLVHMDLHLWEMACPLLARSAV